MATMVPPQKNVEYIFYVCLTSQANVKVMQSNPTLASGDVTVTTDGNAVTNLDTTPDVDPDANYFVKVTVSATEMNGDNIIVLFHDAAGDEWCDLAISIQTAAQSLDTMDTNIDDIETDTAAIDGHIQADYGATEKAAIDLLDDAGYGLAAVHADHFGNLDAAISAVIADTEDLQGNVDAMHDTDLPAVRGVVDDVLVDTAALDGHITANYGATEKTNINHVTADYGAGEKTAIDYITATPPTSAQIKTAIEAVGSHLALIKAVTDAIPDSGALTALLAYVDCLPASLNNISAADVKTAIEAGGSHLALIKAVTDAIPDSGALTALLAYVDCLPASLNNLSAAEVNAEVVDALGTDTLSELSPGIPASTPTIKAALMLLYMLARNKLTTTATELGAYNDAGTKIAKKTLSDNGTTYEETKMASGA